MSFKDYLHEKAEESRHNETLAYLMFLAGAVLFVGGILTTLSLTSQPDWFLIIPYFIQPGAGTFLMLTLTFGGVSLVVFGIVAGLCYSRSRGWYMHELRKASSIEDTLMQQPSGKNNRKRKNGPA